MHVLIARDADELAGIAADVFRERVCARPELAMAVPAGRTPRRMYARMATLQARDPIDYARMRIFSVRPVRLLDSTVRYILTDDVIQGDVCERAVTLGLATIMAAREVIVLVSGEAKRAPLARLLDGPITPDVPASVLRRHPRCLVITDRAARL